MKNKAEIAGVVSLWFLGMVASVPSSWPDWLLFLIAFLSVIAVIIYAVCAISVRRSGEPHYFNMALITVLLTVASLFVSAVQIQGGAQFVFRVVAILLFIFLLALWFKYRKGESPSAP